MLNSFEQYFNKHPEQLFVLKALSFVALLKILERVFMSGGRGCENLEFSPNHHH